MSIKGYPVIERNDDNIYSKMEEFRDSLYDILEASSQGKNAKILIIKSPPFSQTVWVKMVVWVFLGAQVTRRSEVVLTAQQHEYHRFELTIDLDFVLGQTQKKVSDIFEFTPEDAESLIQHMLAPDLNSFPDFNNLGWGGLLLSGPTNPLVAVRREWSRMISGGLTVLGLLGLAWTFFLDPPFGVEEMYAILGEEQANEIMDVVYDIGGWSLVDSFDSLPSIFVSLMLFLGGLYWRWRLNRQHYLSISSGKPTQDPRRLIRMDSWQVSLEGVAAMAIQLKTSITEQLGQAALYERSIQDEKIWQWGVNGKEERNQTVIRFRRAMAFLQIYPYGDALYVGWDAHLNAGTWVEKSEGTGIDVESADRVQLFTIAPGRQPPCEYDLIDCNFLIERLHSVVVKVVKQTVAEHKIDQEIDFQILREGRREALKGDDGDNNKKFKRVG